MGKLAQWVAVKRAIAALDEAASRAGDGNRDTVSPDSPKKVFMRIFMGMNRRLYD